MSQGDAFCVDEYPWWPIRMDDGTTGWAAEGTIDEAWLVLLYDRPEQKQNG